jgi:hypothetical protein
MNDPLLYPTTEMRASVHADRILTAVVHLDHEPDKDVKRVLYNHLVNCVSEAKADGDTQAEKILQAFVDALLPLIEETQ